MEVPFLSWINFQIIIQGHTEFLPKSLTTAKIAKEHFVDDLTQVDRLLDLACFLKGFVIRFVKENTIRIAIFAKIYEFLCYCENGLVPFAFYIVGSLVMYGRENFAWV